MKIYWIIFQLNGFFYFWCERMNSQELNISIGECFSLFINSTEKISLTLTRKTAIISSIYCVNDF